MDVLSYTAFNQQVEYQKTIREKEACYRTLANEKMAANAAGGSSTAITALCWLCEIEPCLLWKPVQWSGTSIEKPKFWDCIPTGGGEAAWTNNMKVCDPTGYYRCGYNCTWCVPPGVTCARFQLWGAGSSSGTSCCCGYGLPGATGAYASVIIPVSSGNSYTICSGCAYCCHPCWGGGDSGNTSYVQGSGLNNFCALGGRGGICCYLKSHYNCGGQCKGFCEYASWIMMMGMCAAYNGNDICLQSSIPHSAYAWPRSSQNRYHMPMTDQPDTTFYGSADDANSEVYGHHGLYGQFHTGDYFRACGTHPPTYGFAGCNDNLQNNTSYEACCYMRGGCCSNTQQGCNTVPSRAGSFNMKCGGHTGYPMGDWGRMGMVCVSYC